MDLLAPTQEEQACLDTLRTGSYRKRSTLSHPKGCRRFRLETTRAVPRGHATHHKMASRYATLHAGVILSPSSSTIRPLEPSFAALLKHALFGRPKIEAPEHLGSYLEWTISMELVLEVCGHPIRGGLRGHVATTASTTHRNWAGAEFYPQHLIGDRTTELREFTIANNGPSSHLSMA